MATIYIMCPVTGQPISTGVEKPQKLEPLPELNINPQLLADLAAFRPSYQNFWVHCPHCGYRMHRWSWNEKDGATVDV